MRPIHPDLFARLMRLPAAIRLDLMEFLGATPVADAQLSIMIARLADGAQQRPRPVPELRQAGAAVPARAG